MNPCAEPVVITGIGPICAAACAAGQLPNADTSLALGDQRGSWFQPEAYFGPRGFKYLTPATRYVLAATQLAIEDAGLKDKDYDSDEQGVIVGTNFSVYQALEEIDTVVLAHGADGMSPMEAPNFSVNMPASTISMKRKFHAFNISLTNAMVAGLEAVWLGSCAVRQGQARMVIAGATEGVAPNEVMQELGMPLADGSACVFILETLAAARARGVRIYAQVGEGASCFFDPAWLNEKNAERRLSEILRKALERVVPKNCNVVHYSGLKCPNPLNLAVDKLVQEIISERCEVRVHQYLGTSGGYVTVSSMLQMGATIVENGEGLLVATSPFGHIALLTIKRVDE